MSQDPDELSVFGYVTQDMMSGMCYCHVFRCYDSVSPGPLFEKLSSDITSFSGQGSLSATSTFVIYESITEEHLLTHHCSVIDAKVRVFLL